MKKLFLLLAMVGMLATACTQGSGDEGNNGNQGNNNNEKPAYNEIWYTTIDGKKLFPNKSGYDTFGAILISNVYSNGKGVLTFDDAVTSIGDLAFQLCSSLTSVTIPDSVTSIGDAAFYGCKSLTSVIMGNNVTSIVEDAFGSCSSLTSVTIPNSVTSIGHCAFSHCESLTAFYGKFASSDNRCLIVDGVLNSFAPAGLISYTIPKSVTSIESYTFCGCSSLTSITIPNSVTSIGDWAFGECNSLISVTIPNSVTSIGYGAFCDCTSLISVYCTRTTPPIGGYNAFSCYDSSVYGYYKPIGCTIYVPRNSVSAYKSAEYWSDYKSYIVGYDF